MSPPHSDLPPLPPDDEIVEISQSADAPKPAARPRRSSGLLGLAVAVILGGLTAVGAFLGIKSSGLLDPRPAPVTDSPSAVTKVQQDADDNDAAHDDALTGGVDSTADNEQPSSIPGAISIPARKSKAPKKPADTTAAPDTVPSPTSNAGSATQNSTPDVEPKTVTNSVPPPAVNTPKKSPKPSDADLKAANAKLDEVYGDRIRKARTFEEKSAIARSILDAAQSETSGSPIKFAMLDRAGQLAVEAAFPQLADEAFNALGAAFDVDLLSRRADAVETWTLIAVKELKGQQETSMQRVLAQRAADLGGQAWLQKRYRLAAAMLTRAEQLRDAAGDRDVARRFTQKKALARSLAARSDKADALDRELQSDPDNPNANLALGLAYAEARRWDRACDCFAKGSDQTLKQLTLEARRLESGADGAVAAGNLWWDAAASAAKDRRDWMRQRAVAYYESVVGRLQGLQRHLVASRMKTVGPVGFTPPEPIVRFTFDRSDVIWQGNSGRLKNHQGDYAYGLIRGGTRVDGAFDEAIQFNGSNQNVFCPSTGQTVGKQDAFTLATFVRVDTYADYNIAGKFYDLFGASSCDFGLRMNRTGTITAIVRGEKGSVRRQDTNGKFPLSGWHHVAMTWDGKTLATYVDGFRADSGQVNPAAIENITKRYSFAIAGGHAEKTQSGGGPNSLNGAVDETRLYLEALTPPMVLHVALGTDI